MKLIYDVKDKPKFGRLVVFAIQQMLAILAATIAVPAIVGNGMTASAAMFGAGVGTIVYLLFTSFKSPVFLGSSFAFIASMSAAFGGAVSMQAGYLGLIIGAFFAGLVYVIIAVVVKFAGVKWINKVMPPVVIGPMVAIIGLSLSGNAIGDAMNKSSSDPCAWYISLICALVTFFVVVICSTYGKKMAKLIPFIIGILAGYAVALIFTIIGNSSGIDSLKVIDFAPFLNLVENGVNFGTFLSLPEFTFVKAIEGLSEINISYIFTLIAAYVPVAFVVFAEHIADHKNLSTVIEKELLEDPGLHRTLLGDGVGSIVGAIFGGCPNTTYGESVGCVAITGNASVSTILAAALGTMLASFISPLTAFIDSIPSCVMGGVCITLYGFIAVSGLKMVQKVDLEENRNLFVVSAILISGIGGLSLTFDFIVEGTPISIVITEVACALILGIITNLVLSRKKKEDK